jgi:hypothetical protein
MTILPCKGTKRHEHGHAICTVSLSARRAWLPGIAAKRALPLWGRMQGGRGDSTSGRGGRAGPLWNSYLRSEFQDHR